MSEKILTRQIIEIKDIKLMVYFINFDMSGFEVLLGINFFKRYEIKITCKINKATFTHNNKDVYNFGEWHLHSMIISCVKARIMLMKGYMRFLVHSVSSSEIENPRLIDMLMVYDFPQVFLDKLPRLTFEREIKFNIELA